MTFLSPILDPLLKLHPLVIILIISFIMTLIVTVIYKFMTDQKKMKEMKEQIKDYQKKMKETKDTKKLLDIQKKAMEVNMQYMMQSMKPTLITFIPVIIVFAWLNSSMGYYSLLPNQDFNVTVYFSPGVIGYAGINSTPELDIQNPERDIKGASETWILKGAEGDYLLDITLNDKEFYKQEIIITEERVYKTPVQLIKKAGVEKIEVGNKVVRPFGNFHLFSWYPGWLGTYIILSLLFSFLLRKVMNVY